jgi:glutamate/aspartate transport system substrate-binding protein
MAEHIINDISKQIGKPIKIVYAPVTSANRIPLVQNGTVDLECGSTTNTRARAKDVDFAYNTYMDVVRIAVKANSGIKDLADLNGNTIATTTGTTSVQILRRNEHFQNVDFNVVNGKDHAQSFSLLESGRADAFIMNESILAANISKAKNPKDFAIIGPELAVEPNGCMLSKDDPAFLKAVNDSIARQVKDGSLAKLYDKWMMQPVPPANLPLNLPLSAATKAAWDNLSNKTSEDFGN